jgi:hypothetical protein
MRGAGSVKRANPFPQAEQLQAQCQKNKRKTVISNCSVSLQLLRFHILDRLMNTCDRIAKDVHMTLFGSVVMTKICIIRLGQSK